MAATRIACCACVALFLGVLAGSAQAAPVLVLDSDGHVRVHHDRFTPAGALPAPTGRAARVRRPRATLARRRTVIGELRRMRDAGEIDDATYAARRAAFREVRRTAGEEEGRRRLELEAVIETLRGIARRGDLTASRLEPLWQTLEANRRWWTTGPLLSSGQRVGFDGSEVVWQYYAGEGLQIQVLGNFGKLNGLWGTRRDDARVAHMVDELLPLAAERDGGLAWEYYFHFGGGDPPWVSGMAQGTALQALARSARRLGRQADILPVTGRALRVFQSAAPEGVRVPAGDGVHYALYSFAPDLRVINGFVQSLIGLHDYARITGDAGASQLYAAGEVEARREVPEYDTGAWSLYSRGDVTHESDLGYHDLLRGFLRELCSRTSEPVYCDTAQHFLLYMGIAPELELRTTRLRGGRERKLRFRLSKISDVSLRITRRGREVTARDAGILGYGTRRLTWRVPRRRGQYTVELTARDLAGNRGSTTGIVKVLKARKRKRHP